MKKELGATTLVSLLALYLAWGSTNLAIKITLETMPPFFMAGVRFLLAGGALYVYLRATGSPRPERGEFAGAAAIGILLLVGGNGGVVWAQQWLDSGAAAMNLAVSPLMISLMGLIWGAKPTRLEWAGLATGFGGVVVLNMESGIAAHPSGALALVISILCWSFGSAWSKQLRLPSGLMAAAVEMVVGGAILAGVSLVFGESASVSAVSARSVGALFYLVVFGSIVGFGAYMHLIRNARYSVATSHAYANPVIAVVLGASFAGEHVSGLAGAAILVIIASVAFVMLSGKKESAAPEARP